MRRRILTSKQIWIKKKLIKNASDKTLEFFGKVESERDIHKYEIQDVEVAVMESRKGKDEEPSRKRRTAELTALVLTMKAYENVDDEIVQKVSEFTGIEKNFIYEKIQELKEKNVEREEKRNVLIRRRDNSFFYKRRYQYELERVSKGSKTEEGLQEKIELHEKNLAKNNEILKRRFRPSPSNEQIASLLGIRPRQVSFCISNARKPKSIERMREIVRKSIKTDGEDAEESSTN